MPDISQNEFPILEKMLLKIDSIAQGQQLLVAKIDTVVQTQREICLRQTTLETKINSMDKNIEGLQGDLKKVSEDIKNIEIPAVDDKSDKFDADNMNEIMSSFKKVIESSKTNSDSQNSPNDLPSLSFSSPGFMENFDEKPKKGANQYTKQPYTVNGVPFTELDLSNLPEKFDRHITECTASGRSCFLAKLDMKDEKLRENLRSCVTNPRIPRSAPFRSIAATIFQWMDSGEEGNRFMRTEIIASQLNKDIQLAIKRNLYEFIRCFKNALSLHDETEDISASGCWKLLVDRARDKHANFQKEKIKKFDQINFFY